MLPHKNILHLVRIRRTHQPHAQVNINSCSSCRSIHIQLILSIFFFFFFISLLPISYGIKNLRIPFYNLGPKNLAKSRFIFLPFNLFGFPWTLESLWIQISYSCSFYVLYSWENFIDKETTILSSFIPCCVLISCGDDGRSTDFSVIILALCLFLFTNQKRTHE